jgi:Putative auto-transporter adhesin, head GIN domain
MINKKIFFAFILIFTISAANAQNWLGKKIKGNGREISEKRTTTEYDAIKVSGDFDVEIISGKEGEITIEAEENLVQYIVAEVKNNTLKIYSQLNVNLQPSANKRLAIIVPIETLDAVTLSGSGNLKATDTIKTNDFDIILSGSGDIKIAIETQKLNAKISGSGDIELIGKSNTFNALVSGSGDIAAGELVTQNADISISGSANVHVHVTENLKARVSGSGDIFYSGNPKMKDTKVSGSGEIKSE